MDTHIRYLMASFFPHLLNFVCEPNVSVRILKNMRVQNYNITIIYGNIRLAIYMYTKVLRFHSHQKNISRKISKDHQWKYIMAMSCKVWTTCCVYENVISSTYTTTGRSPYHQYLLYISHTLDITLKICGGSVVHQNICAKIQLCGCCRVDTRIMCEITEWNLSYSTLSRSFICVYMEHYQNFII